MPTSDMLRERADRVQRRTFDMQDEERLPRIRQMLKRARLFKKKLIYYGMFLFGSLGFLFGAISLILTVMVKYGDEGVQISNYILTTIKLFGGWLALLIAITIFNIVIAFYVWFKMRRSV